MTPQQYCLRWKHHHTNVQSMFAQLLEKERFCDVTLYCSPSFSSTVPQSAATRVPAHRGVSLRAHRVVLAACSELLGTLLGAHEAQGEPVVVIDGADPQLVRALLDYMYTGEMNVHHSQLPSLLKTAEELRIKGLTDIRWNNKDEPPDDGGALTATRIRKLPQTHTPERKLTITPDPLASTNVNVTPNRRTPDRRTPDRRTEERKSEKRTPSPESSENDGSEPEKDRFGVNGGPPPLIKLPLREKDKTSPSKRELSDAESLSPKRQRLISAVEHIDEDSRSQTKSEIQEQDWQHDTLDIKAEKISSFGVSGDVGCVDWSRDSSTDEWADAPADIGSFLHTRLTVDGDHSADDDSAEEPHAASSCSSAGTSELKVDVSQQVTSKISVGPKSGPSDPRFTDVVKLNDYLQHGRRPQFWEENYVKRVMEAVRMKELEMKQAAEILGVSYGTLYGRYRDVYGCINRPYRTDRSFWCHKGPAEVLERLTRGEMALEAAALALGVNPAQLVGYIAEIAPEKGAGTDIEPIPIESDPSLKPATKPVARPQTSPQPNAGYLKNLKKIVSKKVVVSSTADEDSIPATVISAVQDKCAASPPSSNNAAKWPSIRVASLDTLRASPPASTTALMKSRPDLTIVPAKPADQ